MSEVYARVGRFAALLCALSVAFWLIDTVARWAL
jgi:hypothetical protein